MKTSPKDLISLHILVLIFGFTAILGLLIKMPAIEITFYRTLLACILLAAFFWKRVSRSGAGRRITLQILLTGILISGHWIFFFLSARVSTASICLAGLATTALWTAIFEPFFFKKRISLIDLAFGVSVFLGLWVIFRFEFDHALGLVLAILSAILAALFSILNALFVKKENPYRITFLEMGSASLFTLLMIPLYSFLSFGGVKIEFSLDGMDWFYLLILAGICTVYAFSASVELMKRMSPFTINLTLNLEPVYGIVLALLVFGEKEKMSPGFYLGTVFIVLNLILYPMIKRWRNQRISAS